MLACASNLQERDSVEQLELPVGISRLACVNCFSAKNQKGRDAVGNDKHVLMFQHNKRLQFLVQLISLAHVNSVYIQSMFQVLQVLLSCANDSSGVFTFLACAKQTNYGTIFLLVNLSFGKGKTVDSFIYL
jgi:hypothetical protein